MQLTDIAQTWSWHPLTLALVVLAVGFYGRGWVRLRSVQPELATPGRLLVFLAAMGLLRLATLSPIYAMSTHFLAARTLQKVFVAMLAAPLLWLACPFHVMAWGLPARWRRRISRAVLRPSPVRRGLQVVTRPLFTLLFFVSTFLLWHDPQIANWTMDRDWAHRFTLWLLFLAAVLFWWHVVGTAPRLHSASSGWLIAASLVLVEVPNMASGITIAFSGRPLYAYYEAAQAAFAAPARLSTLEDQMVSGALVWVTGSIVYITSLIFVVRRLFISDGSTVPAQGFGHDVANRAMAPGLENRNAHHPWEHTDWR